MVPAPKRIAPGIALRAVRFCRSNPAKLLDVGVGSESWDSAKLENKALMSPQLMSPRPLFHVARFNADRFELDGSTQFCNLTYSNIAKERSISCLQSADITEAITTTRTGSKSRPKLALVSGPKGWISSSGFIAESPRSSIRPGL